MPLLVPTAEPAGPVPLPVGGILDSLDVRADLTDSDTVTAAVVVLELADGRVRVGHSGLSPSDRLGLLDAARLRAEADLR